MEGNADDDIPIANAPPPLQYETIHIQYQKTTAKVLFKIAERFGIAKNGTKRKLFDKIRDSLHAVKVDDESFNYSPEIIDREVFPTWRRFGQRVLFPCVDICLVVQRR